MKKLVLVLVGITLSLSLTACSKAPSEEINATKAAIDAAVGEGAEKYTADAYKAVNERMAAVMDEIKVQDGKLFKSYDKAQQMLAEVKTEADALKNQVVEVKEQLRSTAANDLANASAAVAEAVALLENAPQGKGSLADIAMLKADAQGLEASLSEVQPLIDAGDFSAASDRSAAIQGKAAAISEEVRLAQEKLAQVKIKTK